MTRYGRLLLLVVLYACGSSSSGDGPVGADAAGATFTLTINNFDGWCTITEDGAPFSPSMAFPPGTVVHLNAAPASAIFVWGYWNGTDAFADAGARDTSQSATVTMNADKTVLACCPFAPPASQTCP